MGPLATKRPWGLGTRTQPEWTFITTADDSFTVTLPDSWSWIDGTEDYHLTHVFFGLITLIIGLGLALAANAKLRRDEPKFKRWRSVGLILTYKCNCACEYCYYACDPGKAGLMPVDMAIETWEAVIRLAEDHARIHLTGGELKSEEEK